MQIKNLFLVVSTLVSGLAVLSACVSDNAIYSSETASINASNQSTEAWTPEFLVVLDENSNERFAALSSSDLRDEVASIAVDIINSNLIGTQVKRDEVDVFSGLVNGFSYSGNEEVAASLENDARVAYVERNLTVSINGVQKNPPSWGLDRIDQRRFPLSDSFDYRENTSAAVAYIVDTGVRSTHQEFASSSGSRVVQHVNYAGGPNTDCNGHGTHVAGTVGGRTFGVAKAVSLVGVKVLNCEGSGTFRGVVDGINWIGDNAAPRSVVNMSLGGPKSRSVRDAVTRLVSRNVVVVVAAGNSNSDASNFSPADVEVAITVASSARDNAGGNLVDKRSGFSNYGDVIDLFAPGTSISSAWHTSDSASMNLNGTSMASPHVAGAAAALLSEGALMTPAELESYLKSAATPGVVQDARSPNLLLFTDE